MCCLRQRPILIFDRDIKTKEAYVMLNENIRQVGICQKQENVSAFVHDANSCISDNVGWMDFTIAGMRQYCFNNWWIHS